MIHTHTRSKPGQPGKARKSEHRRRAEGQNSAGGEGNKRTSKTNLHGETDLTKTAHTPKPHDTLRRGTRGELGTKWGTSWWQTRKPKQLIKQQDSVARYLKVVRYSLSGTVVKSCPNWHKRLSSSSELGAQHVSPHQIPKRPHLQEKDMPVAFICSCHVSCQKLKLQVRKKEVSDCSERLHLKECRSLGSLGHPELQEISKRLKTVRPAVALYLNEIPD